MMRMKKLRLDLDQIHVTSFSIQTTRGGGRGTVEGLEETEGSEATRHLNCSEGCMPYVDTMYCDEGVFTWPTCNDYQTCAGYVCPNMDEPTPTGTA
jgi:hypothetical protein